MFIHSCGYNISAFLDYTNCYRNGNRMVIGAKTTLLMIISRSLKNPIEQIGNIRLAEDTGLHH